MSEEIRESEEQVEVSSAAFEELLPGEERFSDPGEGRTTNLDLLMDVTVPVSVCIGTVRRKVADVLSLAPGQVVDLDRHAGEPVDLLVNGKLIAHGEVVVVDDRYGLRITEIAAPQDRLRASGQGPAA